MNIAIDFDGVLFDTESMFRALSQIYNLKIGGQVVDSEKLRFQDRYNWTWEQCEQFIGEYMLDIQRDAPVMPYAKSVIKALSKHHKVYAITSRGNAIDGEIDITNNRLKYEGIEFEQVIYNSSNKVESCKQLNIDLMIEDWEGHIVNLANSGIKCLYYRDNILSNFKHENVILVRDWGDIAAELVNMGLISVEDIKI